MYQIEDADPPQRLGRYQLLDKLDSGGMGAVYLARLAGEGGFEKLVALKLLLPELADSERFVAMFLDEARIAARLSHPNICEIYELGSEGGRHFMAMQYLRGVTLDRVMKRPASGDAAAHARLVASLVAQAAEGLHHAHELRGPGGELLSVVHRDVSPPNLFVTTDGVVKVLDFGIAKARDVESKTRRDEVKGKQSYMSPEQLLGEALDRRSDVFSLGVVLYEGITQSRLFSRDTDYLIAKAILEEPIDDPRQREPAIGAPLAEATMRALARRPDDRFATAREMGEAIAAALATEGGPMPASRIGELVRRRFAEPLEEREQGVRRATSVARGTGATPPTRALGIDTGADTRPAAPAPRRRNRLWAVAGLVVAAAAAVALAVGLAGPKSAAPPTARDAAAPVIEALAPDAAAEAIDADAGAEVAAADAGEPPAHQSHRPRPARFGYVSIDSTPYAVIYIDGHRAGVTPLIRARVKAGKRRVRAVLESGKSRRFTIEVEPGELAPARHLYW